MVSRLLLALLVVHSCCAATCPFLDSTPCNSCASDASNCANTILTYCNSVSWSDPGCSTVGVTCPFRTGNSSPCSLTACTGTAAQLNENTCVSAIIDYCSSETRALRANSGYSIDPACADFSQVSTVLLSTVATTFSNVSTQLSTLANPANGQVSISGCVKPNTGIQSFLFASAASPTSDSRCLHYYFDATSSPKRFNLFYGSTTLTVTCSATFDNNQWHHVAAVLGASTVSFYVDSTLCGSATITGSRPSLCLDGDLTLGGRAPHNTPWDGMYSMVTYHEYALTSSDISRLSPRCTGINEATVPTTATVLFSNSTYSPANATVTIPLVGRKMSFTGCMKQKIANRGFWYLNTESWATDTRCVGVFSDGTLDQIWVMNGAVYATISNTGGAVFDDDTFHKIGVVIENSNVTVYRDGVLFGTGYWVSSTPVTTCPNGVSLVGARTPGYAFPLSGVADQITFHNYALTAAQAASVAAATTCKLPPSDGSTAITSNVVDSPTVGTVSIPGPADSTFSVSMCANMYPNSVGTLFTNSLSLSSSSICFAMHADGQSNFLWLYYNGTKTVVSAGAKPIADGQIHKIVLVVTQSSFTYYLDGVTWSVTAISTPVTTCPSGAVVIGARTPMTTSPTSATISNVIFYDYPLTAAQVSTLATNTLCQESKTLLSSQLTNANKVVSFIPPTIVSGVSSLQGCVRMTANSQTYLLSNAVTSTSSDRRYSLLLDGANRRFRFFSDGIDALSPSTTKRFDDGTWHAVAMVTDSTSAIFYLDGVMWGSTSLSKGAVPMFNASNLIGDRQPAGSLIVRGAINYVKLHNFGLTPSQANLTCGERAQPNATITVLQSSAVSTATLVDTSSIVVVDDYFISACMKMTSGSQTFAFANSFNSATDNRCLSWFFSGTSPKTIRLYSQNTLLVSLANSSIVFDNNVVHRVFLLVQGRIVSFYVDGVLYGTTQFPTDIQPCLTTGTSYIGGRGPGGLLPISGKIADVQFGNYADLSGVAASCAAMKDDDEEILVEEEAHEEVQEVHHHAHAKSMVSDEETSEVTKSASEGNDLPVMVAVIGGVCVTLFAVAVFVRRRRTESIV